MDTLVTYGQTEVARWCGVKPTTVARWIMNYENTPEPDVEVRNRRTIYRGWLPSRKAEWQAFAASRAAAPGAQLVAMREDRKHPR